MGYDFQQVRQLIDERELNESNLDQAAEILLAEAKSQSDARAWGLLCEIQYWKGEVCSDPGELTKLYEKGVEYGKKGCEIDADNIESQFWLGVNYGFLADVKGVLSSLFLIDPIEKCLTRSLEIEESYFYGGPHRAIGWFYHKLPPFPLSKGDSKKGLKHLEKALEFGPDFYLNHIYIAQIFSGIGDKDNARKHLEWVINAPLSPNHEKEDQRDKEKAEKLLNKL